MGIHFESTTTIQDYEDFHFINFFISPSHQTKILHIEYPDEDYDLDAENTHAMELEGYFGTTNNATTPEPDDDDDDEDFEFDGMSFGYGAILGIGSAILIAIIAIVIKINMKRK